MARLIIQVLTRMIARAKQQNTKKRMACLIISIIMQQKKNNENEMNAQGKRKKHARRWTIVIIVMGKRNISRASPSKKTPLCSLRIFYSCYSYMCSNRTCGEKA